MTVKIYNHDIKWKDTYQVALNVLPGWLLCRIRQSGIKNVAATAAGICSTSPLDVAHSAASAAADSTGQRLATDLVEHHRNLEN